MDSENVADDSVAPKAKPAPRGRRKAAANPADQASVTPADPSAADPSPAGSSAGDNPASSPSAESSGDTSGGAHAPTAHHPTALPPHLPPASLPNTPQQTAAFRATPPQPASASPVSPAPASPAPPVSPAFPVSPGAMAVDGGGHQADRRRRSEYPQQRSGEYRSESRPDAAVPTTLYRARRPAFAAGLIIPAVLVGLVLVRILAMAIFGPNFSPSGIIAGSLGLAALPMLVSGLYGLLTGAAYGAEHVGFKLWAKPPLAYLVVGLVLALGAAVAINDAWVVRPVE